MIAYVSTNAGRVIHASDDDFEASGLRVASLIRPGRLAVLSGSLLSGRLGRVSAGRPVGLPARVRATLSA
jgi:mRNA interferase MazF